MTDAGLRGCMGLIATMGGWPTSAITRDSELSGRPAACHRLRSGSGNWPTLARAEAKDAGEYMTRLACVAGGCGRLSRATGVCGEGARASLGAEQPASTISIPVTPRLRQVRES